MTNPMQPLDPIAANSPVTPADGPSAPSQYAQVTGGTSGPAPYNIQAPQPDLSAVFGAANAVFGPRQAQSQALLTSVDGVSIAAGWSGGGGDTGWPNDALPGSAG